MNLELSRQISENTQISTSMKIPLKGAEFFYTGGRTDRHDEAKDRFLQFC